MDYLLQILADKLEFDYELVQPEDHLWGTPLPDGNWSGMLGMLQREAMEFALGPFGVTASRDTVCDFSEPVLTDNSGILVERPHQESDVTGFLKPFTFSVWLSILAGMFAITITFAAVMKAEASIFVQPIGGNSLSTSVMWVVKALTQEATEWLPRTDGSRVLVVTWLLASLVFMSSYSGILTAMLTVPRVTIPIDSLQDLVTQTKMPWRLESGSWMLQYFRESQEGLSREVYDGHEGGIIDCWAAREPISQGRYAAICDHTTMKKAMSWDFSTNGACHLYIAQEVVFSFNLAVAFRTKSPYRELANYWIMKLKEAGVIDMWLRNEIVNTSQCLKSPSFDRATNQISALDLESYVGPFMVLVADDDREASVRRVNMLVETRAPRLTSASPCNLDKCPNLTGQSLSCCTETCSNPVPDLLRFSVQPHKFGGILVLFPLFTNLSCIDQNI
ncbi:glutamate receptor ionotropic, delta-1-like isoform X2 [Eriocheir sinensis]|nr:glutamate receptor ionotropic, delta-1-like isoform X2 [Eriocheir sinensis]